MNDAERVARLLRPVKMTEDNYRALSERAAEMAVEADSREKTADCDKKDEKERE